MFTVFDLETTGLSPSEGDIIQFAYATFDDSNICIKADCLYFYYPGLLWSDEAYAIHNIPLDFLYQYADKFEENLIKMWTVLSGANVCGHNVRDFDCPFATAFLAKFGLTNLRFGIIQDTMWAFKPMTKRKVKLMKLGEACGLTPAYISNACTMWFGERGANTSAHNAMYDVAATALITLYGLRKNYISFDPQVILTLDSQYLNPSLLEADDSGATVQAIPERYNVVFTLIDGDITIEHHFNPDREKYQLDDNPYEGEPVMLKPYLSKVDEGIYNTVLFSTTTLTLRVTDAGDMFEVSNGSIKLTTPDLDLRGFAKGCKDDKE